MRRFDRLRYPRQDTNNGIDREFGHAVELACGKYCCIVWTLGRDEAVTRDYIRHSEREDERLDQMNRLRRWATSWRPDNVGSRVSDPALPL